MESQLLIQDKYRSLRRAEDLQSEKLRESILLSAFKYASVADMEKYMQSLTPSIPEQMQILKRKRRN